MFVLQAGKQTKLASTYCMLNCQPYTGRLEGGATSKRNTLTRDSRHNMTEREYFVYFYFISTIRLLTFYFIFKTVLLLSILFSLFISHFDVRYSNNLSIIEIIYRFIYNACFFIQPLC